MFQKIKNFLFGVKSAWDREFSKRALTKILDNCLLMMWGTYILAWFDKAAIAESLSETIATTIIAVMVGYFVKATFENISKNTTAFGHNVPQITTHEDNTEIQA